MSAHVERTHLAWVRTTLAGAALGAGVLRLQIDQPWLVVTGTVVMGLLLLVAALRGRRQVDGVLPAATVALVLVIVTAHLVGLVPD